MIYGGMEAQRSGALCPRSPLQVGCKLRQHLPNQWYSHDHWQSSGSFPLPRPAEDGALALDQMDLVAVSGLDTYSSLTGVAFHALNTPQESGLVLNGRIG